MAAINLSKDIKNLSQDVRINSAFNCICEQFEKGQISKAFEFFENTVKSEVEFAVDESIQELSKDTSIEDFFNNTTVVNFLEVDSQ